MQPAIIETPKRYQCRHIYTDGHRCGSACLRGEEFCYYHHTTRTPPINLRQRRNKQSSFDLPLPEDRSAIQSSIGLVLQRIASNDIDPRRAGLLLYGLQIASLNLAKSPPQQQTSSQPAPVPALVPALVEEITIHPEFGILAPTAEVTAPPERSSLIAQLLQHLQPAPQSATQSETPTQHSPQPAVLSSLNAHGCATLVPGELHDSEVDPAHLGIPCNCHRSLESPPRRAHRVSLAALHRQNRQRPRRPHHTRRIETFHGTQPLHPRRHPDAPVSSVMRSGLHEHRPTTRLPRRRLSLAHHGPRALRRSTRRSPRRNLVLPLRASRAPYRRSPPRTPETLVNKPGPTQTVTIKLG